MVAHLAGKGRFHIVAAFAIARAVAAAPVRVVPFRQFRRGLFRVAAALRGRGFFRLVAGSAGTRTAGLCLALGLVAGAAALLFFLHARKHGVDVLRRAVTMFRRVQKPCGQGEARIQQYAVHRVVAGAVPQALVAPVTAHVVAADHMQHLVRLHGRDHGVRQGGHPARVEAQGHAVGPQAGAGGVRLQVQPQGQRTEKGMVQHQRGPGAQHASVGLGFQRLVGGG